MEACDLASAGMNIAATVPLLQTAKVLRTENVHHFPSWREGRAIFFSLQQNR